MTFDLCMTTSGTDLSDLYCEWLTVKGKFSTTADKKSLEKLSFPPKRNFWQSPVPLTTSFDTSVCISKQMVLTTIKTDLGSFQG